MYYNVLFCFVLCLCIAINNNVLVRWRMAGFLRTGAYICFSIEPLDRFDPPMAQTKGLAKRKSSYYFQLDP